MQESHKANVPEAGEVEENQKSSPFGQASLEPGQRQRGGGPLSLPADPANYTPSPAAWDPSRQFCFGQQGPQTTSRDTPLQLDRRSVGYRSTRRRCGPPAHGRADKRPGARAGQTGFGMRTVFPEIDAGEGIDE